MPRFLALYMGTQDAEAQHRWNRLPEAEKAERSQLAMQAWGDWAERHREAILDMGAPLGRTLLAHPGGIEPMSNAVAAYVIVEAPTHAAAAAMFENHPHFGIFPGTGVEIMECLPLPGA